VTKLSTPTKAELYAMLAEAIRNTQSQPVCDPQPEPKRETRSHKTRPAQKRMAKTRPAQKRMAKTKRVRR